MTRKGSGRTVAWYRAVSNPSFEAYGLPLSGGATASPTPDNEGMRPSHLFGVLTALAATAAAAASLGFAAPAGAAVRFDHKIDGHVARAACSARQYRPKQHRCLRLAPKRKLHVIVFGRNLNGSTVDGDVVLEERFRAIQARKMVVRPRSLVRLARLKRVRRIALDSPIRFLEASDSSVTPTAPAPVPLSPSYSYPALVTLFPGVTGATGLWSGGLQGAGAHIAVIDSGVAPVADLASRVVQVALPGQSGSLDDTYGHGTLVASVAAGLSADGRYVGLAPAAKVYAFNVNSSTGVRTSDVIAALDWILANGKAHGIRVVNMSLSETTPSSYRTSPLALAAEKVWHAGIVVVASSGNSGPDSVYYAPGNDPYVITVGGSDMNGTAAVADDLLASFSSFGTTGDGFLKPEIVAPGRHIVGPVPAAMTLANLAPPRMWSSRAICGSTAPRSRLRRSPAQCPCCSSGSRR